MSIITETNAKLLEVGEIKLSRFWTNLFLKFKFSNGEEKWLYYSEHVDKPVRLKQIYKFAYPQTIKIGDVMDVNYKIVQCPNKSTKLSISNIVNQKRLESN